MSNYSLMNPVLYGDNNVNKSCKCVANSPEDAAKTIWGNISKYFALEVPSFLITITNENTGNHHGFHVEENLLTNQLSIKQLNNYTNDEKEKIDGIVRNFNKN